MNRPLAILVFLAMLAPTAPLERIVCAAAEPQPPPAKTATSAPPQAPTNVPNEGRPALLNLTFKGGNVADYVEAVRQASGGANVLVMPDAAGLEFPPVKLTAVSVFTAVHLLDNRQQQNGALIAKLQVAETSDGVGAPIYTVDAMISPASTKVHRAATEEGSRVWSIAGLIESGAKEEDILSAIEAAIKLYPEARERSELRLHRETRLLMARGAMDQLDTISAVLMSLEQSVTDKRARVDANEVRRLSGEVATLREIMNSAMQQLSELTKARTAPTEKPR